MYNISSLVQSFYREQLSTHFSGLKSILRVRSKCTGHLCLNYVLPSLTDVHYLCLLIPNQDSHILFIAFGWWPAGRYARYAYFSVITFFKHV
jgi:hypothetical protein